MHAVPDSIDVSVHAIQHLAPNIACQCFWSFAEVGHLCPGKRVDKTLATEEIQCESISHSCCELAQNEFGRRCMQACHTTQQVQDRLFWYHMLGGGKRRSLQGLSIAR